MQQEKGSLQMGEVHSHGNNPPPELPFALFPMPGCLLSGWQWFFPESEKNAAFPA